MMNMIFSSINSNILPADFDWSIIAGILAIVAILGVCYEKEIKLYMKDNFSKKP